MSGFAAGRSLMNDLNPTNVARGLLAFQEVEKRKTEQDMFMRLREQHSTDLRADPEYRKNFSAAMKRDPNALMTLQGLSQARGSVGMMRENLGVLEQLKQRVGQFGATENAQRLGFNPDLLIGNLDTLKAKIRSNPDAGSRELFMMSNMITASMEKFGQEARVGDIEKEFEGMSFLEKASALNNDQRLNSSQKEEMLKRAAAVETLRLKGLPAVKPGAMTPIGNAILNAAIGVQTTEDKTKLLQGLRDKKIQLPAKELSAVITRMDDNIKAAAAQKGTAAGEKAEQASLDLIAGRLMSRFDTPPSHDKIIQMVSDMDEDEFNEVMGDVKQVGFENPGQMLAQLEDENSALSLRLRANRGVRADNTEFLTRLGTSQQEGGFGLQIVNKARRVAGRNKDIDFFTANPDVIGTVDFNPKASVFHGLTRPQPNGDGPGLAGVAGRGVVLGPHPESTPGDVELIPYVSFDMMPSKTFPPGTKLGASFSEDNVTGPPKFIAIPRSKDNSKALDLKAGTANPDINRFIVEAAETTTLPNLVESLEGSEKAIKSALRTETRQIKRMPADSLTTLFIRDRNVTRAGDPRRMLAMKHSLRKVQAALKTISFLKTEHSPTPEGQGVDFTVRKSKGLSGIDKIRMKQDALRVLMIEDMRMSTMEIEGWRRPFQSKIAPLGDDAAALQDLKAFQESQGVDQQEGQVPFGDLGGTSAPANP